MMSIENIDPQRLDDKALAEYIEQLRDAFKRINWAAETAVVEAARRGRYTFPDRPHEIIDALIRRGRALAGVVHELAEDTTKSAGGDPETVDAAAALHYMVAQWDAAQLAAADYLYAGSNDED
jgi:hypothetical protein